MQAFRHSPVWGLASLLASQKAFATQSKEEQTGESTLSILAYWVSKGTEYHVMLFFNKYFQVGNVLFSNGKKVTLKSISRLNELLCRKPLAIKTALRDNDYVCKLPCSGQLHHLILFFIKIGFPYPTNLMQSSCLFDYPYGDHTGQKILRNFGKCLSSKNISLNLRKHIAP
jgi:hypothetical protein